jgi:cellulose synthase/poly-beta-1,6-N-acetylglucosamine synthase-like glycosyltransferase
MEVTTPGRAGSWQRGLAVAAVATLLAGSLVAAVARFEAVGLAVETYVTGFLVALSVRAVADGVVSARPPAPPELPDDRPVPTVSVLVAAYNEADVLGATVAACRNLDYPDEKLEVLVGYETASMDDTATVAHAAATGDPRVRAVARDGPPAGKAAATNHLRRRATGELLVVLDADQRLEGGALRRAVRWFATDPDLACLKGRRFGANPAASLVALFATVEWHVLERVAFVARGVAGGFALFTGGQVFVRANALDAVGGFDESVLLEDVELACRLHRQGERIAVDPRIVSREHNPIAVRAWWSQRKRWAWGSLRAARRNLRPLATAGQAFPLVRLDAVVTLGFVLALPALLLALPSVVAARLFYGSGLPGPAWLVPVLVSVGLPYAVLLADAQVGRPHHRREYLVPPVLWAYLALQGLVVVVAAVEEFLLETDPVYVTSRQPATTD